MALDSEKYPQPWHTVPNGREGSRTIFADNGAWVADAPSELAQALCVVLKDAPSAALSDALAYYDAVAAVRDNKPNTRALAPPAPLEVDGELFEVEETDSALFCVPGWANGARLWMSPYEAAQLRDWLDAYVKWAAAKAAEYNPVNSPGDALDEEE